MRISEILKLKGVFANDIRSRFKNGQIKLNGEITENVDLDVQFNDEGELVAQDVGDFIFNLILQDKLFALQFHILDFETLNESNLDNKLKNIFCKFFVIRFSKKDIILVEKN